MHRVAAVSRHVTAQQRQQLQQPLSRQPTAVAGGGSRKTILVTGCTSGLGLALVENYARMGHRVVGCGRRADRIADLASRLGGDHIFGVCDTSDEDSVMQWAAEVLAEVRQLDVLINNAGVSAGQGMPLWEVPKGTWDQVLGVNVHGVLNILRCFVPAMLKQSKGLIVNISSGTGHSTFDASGNGCVVAM